MMPTIEELTARLDLLPHPEGGFYRETYRSTGGLEPEGKKEDFRSFSTAIYFLLTRGNFSALHRIKSDELWHFYLGDPVHIHSINPAGQYEMMVLGNDFSAGQVPQHVVPAGWWFGSESVGDCGYSLVGCTVAPGFDFSDFELAVPGSLSEMYPEHTGIINRLTRPPGN